MNFTFFINKSLFLVEGKNKKRIKRIIQEFEKRRRIEEIISRFSSENLPTRI